MLNDILGNRGAKDFSDEMGSMIEQLRILGYKDLRPWNEFFSTMKLPQWNWKHLEQRITTNFLHYRSNYLVICGIIIILQLFFCPFEMCSFLLVIIIDIYLLLVMKRPIQLGDLIINEQQKQVGVGVISALLLILTGAVTAITWTILYCVGITGLHMIFRPRSVTSKANKIYEEIKVSGYSSWFGSGNSGSTGSSSNNNHHHGGSELPTTTSSSSSSSSSYDSSNSDLENSTYGRPGDSANMRKRAGGNPLVINRPISVSSGSRKIE